MIEHRFRNIRLVLDPTATEVALVYRTDRPDYRRGVTMEEALETGTLDGYYLMRAEETRFLLSEPIYLAVCAAIQDALVLKRSSSHDRQNHPVRQSRSGTAVHETRMEVARRVFLRR